MLSTIFVTSAYGQSVESERKTSIQRKAGQDYAVLVRNMNHLKAALKTVEMMKEDNAYAIDHFEIVICGKEVTQLNDNAGLIGHATKAGITLSACGMSLKKFSIGEDELPQGVGVVPNGLIRIFDLQEKGYKTITL